MCAKEKEYWFNLMASIIGLLQFYVMTGMDCVNGSPSLRLKPSGIVTSDILTCRVSIAATSVFCAEYVGTSEFWVESREWLHSWE